jgi:hypothetical protein
MTANLKTRQLFAVALCARVICSLVFSANNFMGGGGDGEFFHVAGLYVRDLLFSPLGADFSMRFAELSREHNLESYAGQQEALSALGSGSFGLFDMSTTVPVVGLHALLYAAWDNPVVFPLLNSVVSALSIAFFCSRTRLGGSAGMLLALNPASIFFAATHLKESLTESAVLLLIASIVGLRSILGAFTALALLLIFRPPYALLALAVCVLLIARPLFVRTVPIALGCLLVLAVSPPFYSEAFSPLSVSGPLYSAIHSSELGLRVLAPLVGLLLPFPFLVPLSAGQGFFGTFELLYAITYHAAQSICILHALLNVRPTSAVRWINAGLVCSLITGYLVAATSGSKERYFAPFFPLMLIGAFLALREFTEVGMLGRSRSAFSTGNPDPDAL